MEKINWRLVISAAVIAGAAYAGLTIMAIIQGYEHWVALIFIGGVAKLVAVMAKTAPARNAFAAGFLFAIVALFFQALFLPVYFNNNPEYASIPLPWRLSPVAYIALFAPLGGLLAGLLAFMTALMVEGVAKRVWPGWEKGHD